MWLLTVESVSGGNAKELLFDTEQDVKDWVKRFKPIQYSVRYVKKYLREIRESNG